MVCVEGGASSRRFPFRAACVAVRISDTQASPARIVCPTQIGRLHVRKIDKAFDACDVRLRASVVRNDGDTLRDNYSQLFSNSQREILQLCRDFLGLQFFSR